MDVQRGQPCQLVLRLRPTRGPAQNLVEVLRLGGRAGATVVGRSAARCLGDEALDGRLDGLRVGFAVLVEELRQVDELERRGGVEVGVTAAGDAVELGSREALAER